MKLTSSSRRAGSPYRFCFSRFAVPETPKEKLKRKKPQIDQFLCFFSVQINVIQSVLGGKCRIWPNLFYCGNHINRMVPVCKEIIVFEIDTEIFARHRRGCRFEIFNNAAFRQAAQAAGMGKLDGTETACFRATAGGGCGEKDPFPGGACQGCGRKGHSTFGPAAVSLCRKKQFHRRRVCFEVCEKCREDHFSLPGKNKIDRRAFFKVGGMYGNPCTPRSDGDLWCPFPALPRKFEERIGVAEGKTA